jgi:hypothetical protein
MAMSKTNKLIFRIQEQKDEIQHYNVAFFE